MPYLHFQKTKSIGIVQDKLSSEIFRLDLTISWTESIVMARRGNHLESDTHLLGLDCQPLSIILQSWILKVIIQHQVNLFQFFSYCMSFM